MAAEPIESLLHQRRQILLSGQIGADPESLSAPVQDLGLDRLELVRASRRKHRAAAVLRGQQCNGAADAPARAGDDADLVLEELH